MKVHRFILVSLPLPRGGLSIAVNRDNSRDSRWFGFVERDLIVGRATAVAISLDPDHNYLPRWHRFFRSLP